MRRRARRPASSPRAHGGARRPRATRSRASSRRPERRWIGSRGSARSPPGRSSTRCSRAGGAGDAGVVCVPAFQGFGSPAWDAGARGAVLGLSLGTTRADLARAVVDGILHQVADAVEAIGRRLAVGRRRPLALGLDRPAPRRPVGPARPAHGPLRLDRARRRNARGPRRRGLGPARSAARDPARPRRRARARALRRTLERERWAAARELSTRWR